MICRSPSGWKPLLRASGVHGKQDFIDLSHQITHLFLDCRVHGARADCSSWFQTPRTCSSAERAPRGPAAFFRLIRSLYIHLWVKLWFPVQLKWSFERFLCNVSISAWFSRVDADVSVEPSAKVCTAHFPLQRPSQQDWSIHSRLILFFSHTNLFSTYSIFLFHNLDKADTIYEKLYTQTPAGPHWLRHGSSQQKHNNLRFF